MILLEGELTLDKDQPTFESLTLILKGWALIKSAHMEKLCIVYFMSVKSHKCQNYRNIQARELKRRMYTTSQKKKTTCLLVVGVA